MPKNFKALKGFNLVAGKTKVPLQLKTMSPEEYVKAKQAKPAKPTGTIHEPKQ